MSPLVWVLLCSCTAWAEVFRWHPPSALDGIRKRQDGYSPDYNSCGTGHDCSSCGDSFEQCPAAASLALFCYDPTAGQKCCPNGQGKACDRGYYCAMDDMHQTWCCPDELDLAQCAASHHVPTLESAIASTTTSPLATSTTAVTVFVTIQKTTTVGSVTSTHSTTTARNMTTTRGPPSTPFTAGSARNSRALHLGVVGVLVYGFL